MSRELMMEIKGHWVQVDNAKDFDDFLKYGSKSDKEEYPESMFQNGSYQGPGKYWLLMYSQKCPRGCCYDDVYELISEQDFKEEIKEELECIFNDTVIFENDLYKNVSIN